jgi:hypothetical protein
MRWSAVCGCVFALLLTSACPTAHRPEGYLDRATRADIKGQVKTKSCDEELYRELCVNGLDEGDEEEMEKCLKTCFQ